MSHPVPLNTLKSALDNANGLTQEQLSSLHNKCPYSELPWSAFFRIWTEYGDTPYLTVFSPNECGKMQSRITPNWDTFYQGCNAKHVQKKNA